MLMLSVVAFTVLFAFLVRVRTEIDEAESRLASSRDVAHARA
jgi:hypothetical protein